GTPPTFTRTPTITLSPTVTATPTCGGPSSFHILIVYGDSGAPPSTLQTALLAQSGVTAVSLFDATTGTPSLAQLQQNDIVVAYSNNPYLDPVTLGNNLADYQDGGGVVVANF